MAMGTQGKDSAKENHLFKRDFDLIGSIQPIAPKIYTTNFLTRVLTARSMKYARLQLSRIEEERTIEEEERTRSMLFCVFSSTKKTRIYKEKK